MYLSRIEKDRVFDPEIDGKRVSTMSNKQRTLINVGIDEVNVTKKSMRQCLKPKVRNNGFLATAVLTGTMLSEPTIAASQDASLIVYCTGSQCEPTQNYFGKLEEAAGRGVQVLHFADQFCDDRNA